MSSQRRLEDVIGVLERGCDFAVAASAVLTAYLLYHRAGIGKHVVYPPPSVIAAGIVFAALFVMLLDADGGYSSASLLRVRRTERVLRSACYAILLLFPVAFFSGRSYSRLVLFLSGILAPVFVLLEKCLAAPLIDYLCKRKVQPERAVIYGTGAVARKIYSALLRTPKLGLNPIAFVDDSKGKVGKEIFEASYQRKQSAKIIAEVVSASSLAEVGASALILSKFPSDPDKLVQILDAAKNTCSTIYYSPGLVSNEAELEYLDIDGVMLARELRRSESRLYELSKRCLDIVLSMLLLVLLLPVLAMVALAVRCSSKGPVFFRQMRTGRNGHSFLMYKFRSMYVDAAAYEFSPTESQDPRITPVGRLLRKTSLDELPQLLNVLIGHMSLVGPRPEMPFITERYTPLQRQRLSVKPGITGIWQLSADRAFQIHENLEYDLYYVRNQNLFMDMAILIHTLWFAMRGV